MRMAYSLPEMERIARQCDEVLSRWDGGVWRVESYGMSHPTLTIWLYDHREPTTSVRINCVLPRRMNGPFGWSVCRLRVCVQPAEPINLYVLRDENAGLEITCGHINVGEAPAPHWISGQIDEQPAADH